MMMCSRCNKRPAVVFITTMKGDEKHNEGLCLKCAKEMNIPQVSEYIKQLGLNEDELESEMEMLFGSDEFQSMMEDDEDGEDVDGFKTGGTSAMPPSGAIFLTLHLQAKASAAVRKRTPPIRKS